MDNMMQEVVKDTYKVIVLYRDALTNAFLQGHVSLEVKSKSDLFFTANFLERLLAGQQPTEEDVLCIDKECAALDLMCRVFPEQFKFIEPQLKAVGKAFETWQSILN